MYKTHLFYFNAKALLFISTSRDYLSHSVDNKRFNVDHVTLHKI